MQRVDSTAPHEVLLVLDANQGQNALAPAVRFHEAIGVTGLVLTKLDGTAKGGIVIAIARKLCGVVGALTAWGLIVIAVMVLAEPAARLATLYGSRFTLNGPTRDDVGALVLAGAFLGWLGAWLSASRHLKSIEPRA